MEVTISNKLLMDTLLGEMAALLGGLMVVHGRVVGKGGELKGTYPAITDL